MLTLLNSCQNMKQRVRPAGWVRRHNKTYSRCDFPAHLPSNRIQTVIVSNGLADSESSPVASPLLMTLDALGVGGVVPVLMITNYDQVAAARCDTTHATKATSNLLIT